MRASKAGLLLAMLLALSIDVRAQSDQKEPSAVISGKITIDGAPLAGVPVLLLTATTPVALSVGRSTTDADGNYRLTGIPAGEYRVNAFAPAYYYPTTEYFRPRGRSVTINDAEIADGVDFTLVRGGVITGRVTDSAGKPVVEEYIHLMMLDENGKAQPVPFENSNYTDDRGVYRVYGLEPGRYMISVGVAGGQMMGGPIRFYPATYHPGVTDQQRASIVEITSGGEASAIDIAVGKMNMTFTASGRVIDAETGKGVPGVVMGYGRRRPDDKGINSTGIHPNWFTDSDGGFRLEGMPSGHYAAFGVPQSESDYYSDLGFFDIQAGDVEGVEVKLHHGGTISGFVGLDPTADPALNTSLIQLKLTAVARTDNGNQRLFAAPISADGSFRIPGLTAGNNRIWLAGSGQVKGFYISRIQRDGAEQPDGMIEVRSGEQVTGVRVTLSYGNGVIRGQVKYVSAAPSPASDVWVVARPEAVQQPATSGKVDSRGMFVIEGLRDGEYDLSVQIYSGGPGRTFPSSHQKVTVAQGTPAEAVLLVDLSRQQ